MQRDAVLRFTVRNVLRMSSVAGTPCCIDCRVAMGEPPTMWPRPAAEGVWRPPRPPVPMAACLRPLPRMRIGVHSSAILMQVLLSVSCVYNVNVDVCVEMSGGEVIRMKKRGKKKHHVVRKRRHGLVQVCIGARCLYVGLVVSHLCRVCGF